MVPFLVQHSEIKEKRVPYFRMTRRHRIFENEIPYVTITLADQIEPMTVDQMKYGEGQALFKVLWRLKEHRPGHPSYPDINTRIITDLIDDIRFLFGEYIDQIPVDCVKSRPGDPIPETYG